MSRSAWTALIIAMESGAIAATVAPALPQAAQHAPADCLGGRERHAFSEPTAIPDNDPAGVTVGPLHISDGTASIHDVVLELSISHPYAGELTIALHYDIDGDGSYDASSPIELYLSRLDPCALDALWACPVELSGTYFLEDTGWKAAGELVSFDTFDGLSGGGDFYLTAVDETAGNTGIVSDWSIYIDREQRPRRPSGRRAPPTPCNGDVQADAGGG